VLDLQRGIRGDAGCISMTRARVRDIARPRGVAAYLSSSTMALSSLHFPITIIRPAGLARTRVTKSLDTNRHGDESTPQSPERGVRERFASEERLESDRMKSSMVIAFRELDESPLNTRAPLFVDVREARSNT